MEYKFKQIKLSNAERLWLTEILKSNFSKVNAKSLMVKLLDELPEDFNPDKIDNRLVRDNYLTLIGLWHIDPQNSIFDHVSKILKIIKDLIRKNPEISQVTANKIPTLTDITIRNAEIALGHINTLGNFFGGGGLINEHYGMMHASFGQGHSAYNKFLRFKNLEEEMERFFTSNAPRVFGKENKRSNEDRTYGEGKYGEGVYGGSEENNQKRRELLKILQIKPAHKQNQQLRDLAKEVGAQQPNASGVEFRDKIVHNIHLALQTASMIDLSGTKAAPKDKGESAKTDQRGLQEIIEVLKNWQKSEKTDKDFEAAKSALPPVAKTYDILCRTRGQCGAKTTNIIGWLGTAARDNSGYYRALFADFASPEVIADLEKWLEKPAETGRGNKNDESKGDADFENVFRENLIAFLITEKNFPSESLNHGVLAEAPDLDLTVTHPDTDSFLAIFDFKSENYRINSSKPSEFMAKVHKKGFVGKYNPFVYMVTPSKESNEEFVIFEVEDDETSNEISYEDFPFYNQLLFASPLSGAGRRLCRSLVELAKDKHGLSINASCEDYINLQIKKNKRTAAQIHRLNDSDKNIALVLAGYQEVFPDFESEPYMVRGEINQISGNTKEYPKEMAWLNGNVNHERLRYRAGVYIIQPGSLVLEDIKNEVGKLLDLARKNAGGGMIESVFYKLLLKVFGKFATLRSDEVSDVDALGRDVLIEAFADTLIHTEFRNGFTMALMGNWGEGKSSVMEILKRRLKEQQKDRFDFALFNAWEYEQTDNLAAGMAQEVVKGLKSYPDDSLLYKIIDWLHKINLTILFNLIENRWNLFKLFFFGAISWFSYLYLKPLGFNLGGEDTLQKLAVTGSLGIGGLATLMYLFKTVINFMEHPLPANLEKYFKLPNYAKHLGLIPVLKGHIKTLCMLKLNAIRIPFTKIKIGKDRKLLVFVDDLDRCKPDCIAETLDVIRLVMPIPNVIVMICIDHRIAFKAVEKHYKTLAEKEDGNKRSSAEVSRDYLGKIIQLPVRLEPVKHEKLKKYIYDRLFDFKENEWKQFKDLSEWSTYADIKDTNMFDESKDIGTETSRNDFKIVGHEEETQVTDVTDKDDDDDDASEAGQKKDEQKQQADDKESNDEEINDEVDCDGEIVDSPEEGKKFYKLAGLFEFNNPRQLLRLHNSFRFLKALGRGENINTLEILTMLFWQEFLHNWPMKDRGRCMASLIDDTQVEEVIPKVRGVLKKVKGDISMLFNDEPKRYEELAKFVRVVVLPHNEEGVLDTKEEIDEWLDKKAEEEEKIQRQLSHPKP